VTPTLFVVLLAGTFVSIIAGVLGNWLETPEWAKKPSRVLIALAVLGLAAVLIAWVARNEDPKAEPPGPPTPTRSWNAAPSTKPADQTKGSNPAYTTSATPRVSARERYIRAADAVCLARVNQAGQLRDRGLDELATAKAQVDVIYQMLTDWRAVPPPAADRRFVDGLIDDYRRVADLLYASNRHAENGDAANQAAAWKAANAISDTVQAKGRDFGFRVCTG
jgi:hypothetical protein